MIPRHGVRSDRPHMQINIQFLRFLAALSVAVLHTGAYAAVGGEAGRGIFGVFSWFGYAGVDVFFVISGYIMWTTTRTAQHPTDVGYFIYKRAARIYLGYWPYCLMLLLLLSYFSVKGAHEIDYLGSIFLTQTNRNLLLLVVTWTLTYELYFYVVFAGVLLLPHKIQARVLAAILMVVVVNSLLFCFVDHDTLRQHARWVLKGNRFFLSPFCAEFFAGCLLAVYFEKVRRVNLWFSGAVCLVLVTAAILHQQNSPLGAETMHQYPHKRVAFFGTAALALVAFMVELEHRGMVFFKRASLLLGGASYSLYLCHIVMLRGFHLAGLHKKLLLPFYDIYTLLLMLVFVIVGYSVLHYLYIEKPLMALARKVLPDKEVH